MPIVTMPSTATLMGLRLVNPPTPVPAYAGATCCTMRPSPSAIFSGFLAAARESMGPIWRQVGICDGIHKNRRRGRLQGMHQRVLAIRRKRPEEIEVMARAGRILADCLEHVASRVAPGVSTA